MLARYQFLLLLSLTGVIGGPSTSTGPHSVGHAVAAAPLKFCSGELFPRGLFSGFESKCAGRS